MDSPKAINMATDSLGKLLIRLSIPAVAGQIINVLYNIVDRIYIGHIEDGGVLALTGVGLGFPIIMIISAFSCLIGMGGAPLAAIKMGEGKNDHAERILGNCLVVLCSISAVLTVVFYVFKEPLLMMFGASSNTIGYATDYLGIYVLGTIFTQISMGLNAFINTQGFTKFGMLNVMVGAICNIILDPIFIFVFDMGVKGAAIATVISQAVSAVMVMKFLMSDRTKLRFRRVNFKLEKKIVFSVMALGVSPFVMQSTESLVSIVLNSSLQHFGGDPAVGAMTIITSVLQLFMMPLNGIGQGAQPIISFNFGARKIDRVRKVFKMYFTICVMFTTVAWLLIMLIPQVFVGLFNNDPQLMSITVWGMRIFFGTMFMFGIQSACQQAFLAMGQAKISLFLACLRKVILLVPLALILPRIGGLGLTGIFLSEPIADFVAACTTGTLFYRFSKRILSQYEE